MGKKRDAAQAIKRERDSLRAQIAKMQEEAAVVTNSGATATFPLSDPNAYANLFGPVAPGVTPQTALTYGPVYRCAFLISGAISMLDFRSYDDAGNPDERIDTTSAQARLIGRRPNPRYSLTGFWRSVVTDMLLNGNGIVWIERDRGGNPLNLWWVPWGRCGVRFQKMPWGSVDLVYSLTMDSGEMVVAHQDDVMHFGGSPLWNLFFYESPISAYALSIGIGLAADKYAKSYFDNGMSMDSVITYPTGKTPDQAQEIRARLNAYFGGANRFSGPLVLDGGAKFEALRINAQDAQLLDTRRMQVSDIGMIFGVPDHLLNQSSKSTSFGKGLEELTQAFLDFTCGPHLKTIEDEVNYKLYGNGPRIARFDRDSFVRGDLKSRAEALQVLLGGAQGPGSISQNESRARLGVPKKRGDQYEEILGWGTPQSAASSAVPQSLEEQPAPEPAQPAKARRVKK